MKFTFLLTTVFFLTFQAILSSPNEAYLKSRIVAEVGKEKLSAFDIDKAYRKSINRSDKPIFDSGRDSVMDFLNLYTGFRLKVNDAYSRGFDKDSSVVADINQNRKILAESFYYDQMLINPAIDRFLEMRKKEYQVGIILIRHIPEDDTQTLTPERKVEIVTQKLRAGESFEELAKTYSDDKRTGNLGGLIQNYVTSGKVQRPIENAIYKTGKGQVYPEPVVTDFGYFFIKVFDVADRIITKPRHLLITVNDNRTDEEARKKADSLYKLLQKGADFDKLVLENSDDIASAEKGGDLGGYYSRSTGLQESELPLVAEFENAVYKMKKGEISEPVKTAFGYHIIYLEDAIEPIFEAEIDGLKNLYKTLYYTPDKNDLMDSLKLAYGYKLYDDVLIEMLNYLDTNKTNMEREWDKNIPQNIQKKTLYEILKKKTTVADFIYILNNDGSMRGAALNEAGIRKAIVYKADNAAFDEATKNLEKDYPEFASLMKEFRDGIMLFKVEAIEVWDKLNSEDLALARAYYDSTKTNYFTDLSYDISEIYVMKEDDANAIYQRAKSGEDFGQIASVETQRAGYRERNGNWGIVTTANNLFAQKANELNVQSGGLIPPFQNERGYSIVKVNEVFLPRQMTFEEAKSRFAPRIQEIRQKNLNSEWLAKLSKKFNVKIHDKVIEEVINQYKSGK
ncbi:MAG: peptidylprolyl isomerase [Candidatus Kapabacteria bacterium]|nr:peptidylprolyl isomerase [Candidatus Kapabacteria bacterium]